MLNANSTMTGKMIKISPDDTMSDAYRLMYLKGIRHLPVFDHKNILVGILSDRDIQKAMFMQKEVYLDSELKVREFMHWPVFSVQSSTPLRSIIIEMMNRKISAVLVQNDNREYIGIVTTEDLLQQLLKTMEVLEELKERPLSLFMSNTLY